MIAASGTDVWSGLRFLGACVAGVAAVVIVIWLIARSRGTTASLAVRAAAALAGVWLGLAVIMIPVALWRLVTMQDIEVVPSPNDEWDAYCFADGSPALVCNGSLYTAMGVGVGPHLLIAAGTICSVLAAAAPILSIFVLCMSALRNSVFPSWIPRLFLACGTATLVFGTVAPVLSEMGNGLAAAQVLPDDAFVSYYFEVPWWPALVALACGAFAAIFRHGARLQRDTEGLV